jgi:hypothetical protein
MADYSSVLARAVQGKKTAEERRAVYDRARSALVNQLRSIDPPLPESDITRQRMALEDAIGKVEAGFEAQAVAPPPPPPPPVAQVAPPPAVPAPEVTAAAPPPPPPPPPVAAAPAPQPEPTTLLPARPAIDDVAASALGAPTTLAATATATTTAAASTISAVGELAATRTLPALEPDRPAKNRRPLVFVLVAAIILAAVGGTVWAIRGGLFGEVATNGGATPSNGAATAPKTEERVPTATAPGGAPATQTPAPAQAAVVAQAAILYEENADTSRGADTFRGTVVWRLDTEQAPAGQERIIRGLVDISDRGLRLLLVIRRNIDPALPASHTVEILFDVAPTFVHGAVESLGGVRMKPSEQAQGLPLMGATARITGGYFLIGLSAIGADRERNVVLLRDRPWLDLPIVYRNGRRAVLAIEKGVPGERIFQDAFQAWGG